MTCIIVSDPDDLYYSLWSGWPVLQSLIRMTCIIVSDPDDLYYNLWSEWPVLLSLIRMTCITITAPDYLFILSLNQMTAVMQALMYVLHSENLLNLLTDLGYGERQNAFRRAVYLRETNFENTSRQHLNHGLRWASFTDKILKEETHRTFVLGIFKN